MAGGAHDVVEAQVAVAHDVEQQDDLHVFPGVRQRGLRGAEDKQHGVEPDEEDNGEECAQYEVEHDAVAQHLLRRAVVLLTQTHGDHGGGADAHHRTEGRPEIHEGERGGQAGQSLLADTVADEGTVHDVVERSRRHGNDGRQGILPEQPPHGPFAEFGRYAFELFGHFAGKSSKIISFIQKKRERGVRCANFFVSLQSV